MATNYPLPAVPQKKPRKKNIKPPAGNHQIIFPKDTIMDQQWQFQGQPLLEIPDGVIAFVYCITNKLTGRKYIGKKQFFKTKTRSIKKQLYRERVQSDFPEYYGSNDELNLHVIQHGRENFIREILLLCETLGQANYYEAKYQMQYDVLKDDSWYNSWISLRVTSKHMKPQHYSHKMRLDLLKWKGNK